jgi:hypothetical protein
MGSRMGSLDSDHKKAPSIRHLRLYVGGAEEDRTPDLCIANAALSQLSYRPTKLDSRA